MMFIFDLNPDFDTEFYPELECEIDGLITTQFTFSFVLVSGTLGQIHRRAHQ